MLPTGTRTLFTLGSRILLTTSVYGTVCEVLFSGTHVRGPDKDLLFVISFGGGENIGLSIFNACNIC